MEELIAAGAPVSAHWFADRQTALLILKFGTPAQRDSLRSAHGAWRNLHVYRHERTPTPAPTFSSVRTRAVRTETGWRLERPQDPGQPTPTARSTCALVRTSGQHGDRHKGLSQVLIDLSLPGISYRPIKDLAGDAHFC
ncbi:hypothetical protein ACU4GD_20525 [Cupriavidus basilensis]